MSNPKLALIPSGYKNSKVYSILPNNGGGDFTFARNSGGTRVRKDGLIETVAADTPRLDWSNGNCPNLLLEPLRTNRQIRSEQFDNAAWVKQPDITVTADQVTAPTGELIADKIQRGSTINTNNYISDFVTKSSSTALDLTTSVFVKQGEGDFFAFRSQGLYANGRGEAIYQFSTNTLTTSASGQYSVVTSSVENYKNGWYRLSATFNTDAHSQAATFFSPRGTSGQIDASDTSTSAFVYLWGCQVEEGSSLSSYIETQGSTTTRNADTCTNAGDANTFNDNEGVLYAELKALSDDGTTRRFSVSDGTNNNRVLIGLSSSNRFQFVVSDGGSVVVNQLKTVSDITEFNKVAISYKENDCKIYINGSLVGTDTVATMPSGLNTLNFNQGNHDEEFYGKVKDLRYYDTALTDAELTELTK